MPSDSFQSHIQNLLGASPGPTAVIDVLTGPWLFEFGQLVIDDPEMYTLAPFFESDSVMDPLHVGDVLVTETRQLGAEEAVHVTLPVAVMDIVLIDPVQPLTQVPPIWSWGP